MQTKISDISIMENLKIQNLVKIGHSWKMFFQEGLDLMNEYAYVQPDFGSITYNTSRGMLHI